MRWPWGESNRGEEYPSLGHSHIWKFSRARGTTKRFKRSEVGGKPRKCGILEAKRRVFQGGSIATQQSG